MQLQFYNVINDELHGSEETHQVTDPRTEEPLWPCPVATTQDFEDAVTAAQKAFKTWSLTTIPERQALLVKLAENLQDHADELTEIIRKETGKSASPIDLTSLHISRRIENKTRANSWTADCRRH